MEIKKLYKSKKIRYAVLSIVALAFILMVFQAGVYLGYHRAIFSAHLGDNFVRTFEGGATSSDTAWFFMSHRSLPSGYGTVGQVIKTAFSTATSTIVVADQNNVETTVLLNKNTILRHFRDTASTTNIMVGNTVVVIGSPNSNGEIVARLIRIIK